MSTQQGRTPEGVSPSSITHGPKYDPARQVALWEKAQQRHSDAEKDMALLAAPLETAAANEPA